MSTDFNEQLDTKIASESKLTLESGKVARFAYTEQAFDNDIVAGTATYDYNQQQNVPLASETQMSPEIISKGLRSQASSFTRMGVNHFFGRCSYNINKLAVHVKDFLNMFKAFIKEGDNEWSPTVLYEAGDVIYFMSTLNYEPCKRTFVCIVDCPSVNLPPVYTDGSLINTAYWKEISGRVASLAVGTVNSGSANVATFNGSITVNGNITQSGTPYETHAEQLYTKKDNIITREDATGALPSGQYSGIKVNNYDGNGANGILAYRSDGTAVVGDETGDPAVESLQPLLTRDEESQLTNGAPFVWDAVHKRAVSGAIGGTAIVPASSTTITGSAVAINEAISIRFTADIDGTDTATPLVLTYNNVQTPLKAVKEGQLVDVLAVELLGSSPSIYRYIQANTIIQVVFDGTNFVMTDNFLLAEYQGMKYYANGDLNGEDCHLIGVEIPTGRKWSDGSMIYKQYVYENRSVGATEVIKKITDCYILSSFGYGIISTGGDAFNALSGYIQGIPAGNSNIVFEYAGSTRTLTVKSAYTASSKLYINVCLEYIKMNAHP